MQINSNQVFVGDLKKVTRYECASVYNDSFLTDVGSIIDESELFKKDVILIEVQEGFYVELEKIKSFVDELKIKSAFKKDGFIKLGGMVLSTDTAYVGQIYVDKNSIRPYYAFKVGEIFSHKVLKKSIYK